ncbi:MAG: hypothetical protein KDC53_14075 [Saprospiraceae bacterium]|nr:hypothetical protein [Saprospiraceae bacterium]
MTRILISHILLLSCFLLSCNQKFAGPLHVSSSNPRYFTNRSQKAIYLTGSHTWNNLVHFDYQHDCPDLDYDNYLLFLKSHHHNFIRLWTWELLNWDNDGVDTKDPQKFSVYPHPWKRTGPGLANDDRPKFDLNQFDPVYFTRLESRVKAAAAAGIYISVMLFEGYGTQFTNQGYQNHPFYPANNINNLPLDSSQETRLKIHQLLYPEILTIQETYVKHTLEALNKYDNVLYEISNENHPASTAWQYHMIEYIKKIEKSLPKQHPVGMTFQFKGGSNETLFSSPADWISPNEEGGYKTKPPVAQGRKVIINDTDHLWGIGGTEDWVWQSFFQGMNVIYMDPYQMAVYRGEYDQAVGETVRTAMGYTLMISDRIGLKDFHPAPDLCSTKYCLANPAQAYLLYFNEDQAATLDLSDADEQSMFTVSAFHVGKGRFEKISLVHGGTKISLSLPGTDYLPILYLSQR